MRIFCIGVGPYFGLNDAGQKHKRQNSLALYPGQHPALVPQELFETAQAQRSLRRSAPVPPGKTPRHMIHPLSGLLFCAKCGKPMRASGNAQFRRYYRCSTHIQRIGQCDQPTVYGEVVEQQVGEFLSRITLPPGWQQQVGQKLMNRPDRKGEYESVQ